MATVYQLPSGSWRGQARIKGLTSRSAVFDTETKAKRWALEQEAEMRAYKRTVNAGEISITFSDMCSEYTSNSAHVRRKETSKRVIERQIKTLIEHLGNKTIQQLDHAAINAYKEKRLTSYSKKQPTKLLSAAKVRLELSTLSAILKLARQRGYTKMNPFDLVERPVGKPKVVRISLSAETSILEALSLCHIDLTYCDNPAYKPAWYYFQILLNLGCRPGELAALPTRNVDFNKRQILFASTKNTDSRTVPVAESDIILIARWLIEANYPADCPYVFASKARNGKWIPYEYYTAWKLVKKLIGTSFPSDITPHSFRHERISRWFESGQMSDAEVMTLSGHRDYKSLQVYTHIRSEKLRQRIENIRGPESNVVIEHWIKTKTQQADGIDAHTSFGTDLKALVKAYEDKRRAEKASASLDKS